MDLWRDVIEEVFLLRTFPCKESMRRHIKIKTQNEVAVMSIRRYELFVVCPMHFNKCIGVLQRRPQTYTRLRTGDLGKCNEYFFFQCFMMFYRENKVHPLNQRCQT